MLYKRLIINGKEYLLAVSQAGSGAPAAATPGSLGILYMDTDTGDLYKCTGGEDGAWEWKELSEGGSDYKLPVGGAQLGGVKNGGNVVINEDGTMTAPGSGSSQNVDLTGYAKETWVQEGFQPKGNYLTEVPEGYAKSEDIPTKPEDIGAQPKGDYLTAVPTGYATEEFVKNKIAEAELGGEEVDLSGYAQKSELPTKVSQLQNDSGYLTEHQDISGKLDASALPTAINTALAQAKANGEFDGKDGEDGFSPVVTLEDYTEVGGKISGVTIHVQNKDSSYTKTVLNGSDGRQGSTGIGIASIKQTTVSTEDGGDNVFMVTLTDGNVAAFTVKNGSKGSTGATGAAGKDGSDGAPGSDGQDGYTPVKGVDYYTDGEKAEFEAYLAEELAKRGQLKPEFANSIDECADTSKLYVLPDGYIYAYMPSTGPGYTNLAGTITYDKRLSSSGKASSSAMAGAAYTDFIPVKHGQIVRIKNFDVYSSLSSSAFPYVCFYTGASESNVVTSTPYVKPGDLTQEFKGSADSVTGGVVTWTAFTVSGGAQHSLGSTITHIRISGKYFADKEIIVTVDEEITEGGSGGYAWQNTGHAFVPADYEDRIVALEKAIGEPVQADYSGNILYGKKWVACGDSFTANGYNASDGFDESVYIYQDGRFSGKNIVYPYIIGLRNNMDIVNKASGGQTMAASSNSFMSVYQNIDADADYITIMLGINDKVQGLPVGELEDSTESTFCGAFNIAMEHILENHPFAHIGIMVSHGTNEEIMEATRGIAERWGVPYLDYGSPQVPLMNRYTGRNVCAKAQEIRERNFCVISDGTTVTNAHPNTAAHEYESTFIEAWLRTL